MYLYLYKGPVMVFETCVNPNWVAETYAVSEKKARSNLEYRYRKENNKTINSRVILPGSMTRKG